MFPFHLNPADESKAVNVKYIHQYGVSKLNDVKFLTVFENSSYYAVPVFITDRSIYCSYEQKEIIVTNPCFDMNKNG